MGYSGKDLFLEGKDILCYAGGRIHIYRSGSVGPILSETDMGHGEFVNMAKIIKFQVPLWEGWISYNGKLMKM